MLEGHLAWHTTGKIRGARSGTSYTVTAQRAEHAQWELRAAMSRIKWRYEPVICCVLRSIREAAVETEPPFFL